MTQYGEGSEVAGRFVIQERIGEGGMGAVFKATQTSLDRVVALKMLHAQNAFTARARRRFAREARAIARLNHPHIAGVYDFGIDDDGQTMWLAMEFIDGVGMTPMKQQDIDLLRLLALTDQILSALSAAHARGIIHRDLKPSNILLSSDTESREIIKLVDFGLAATQDGELDLSGAPGLNGDEEDGSERMILGTPRYMAPEIFKRAPADPRVDLYALGVILFEILCGVPPYPGDDPRKVMKAHLNTPIPQLAPRHGVEVTVDLERTIYQLLAKKPADRFQSASEVRERIGTMINEFSYVPWMLTGPRNNDASSFHLAGNISTLGFQSGFGGQTIAPSAMFTQSKIGAAPAPLVGRGHERRVLEQRLRAALNQGQGSVILLDGEAGVGRSRLAQWVRVRVDEAGVMRAYTGSHSRGSGGFDGMRGVLEELLGSSDFSYDDLPYAVTKRLKRWDFSTDEAQIIISLLRPSREDLLWEVGEASAHDQDRIFATVERLLRKVAEDKPVLIVLEDLHDAGDPTIGFLEHLAVGMHLSPAPIVMLATMRSEEVEHTSKLRQTLDRLVRFGSEDIVRITLKRLELDEAKELALKMLPLDDAVATRLAERAEGNPLYLKQILRFLQESGKLVYDSGKWGLAEGVQLTREIPDEVADMMRYRTAQVCRQHRDPEAMKALLERASVLGSGFDYRLLRTMLQIEPGQPWVDDLDSVLEGMIRGGVLREIGTSGEDVLEFEHGLMREVLLQDLKSRRGQRQLHRLAAEAKVKHWGTRANARALEIVEHYELAKEPAQVYRYTLKAAQAAHAAGDLKRAMELFRRAEDINAQLSQPDTEGLDSISMVLRGDEVALEVAHLELRLAEYDSVRASYRKLLNSTHGAVSMWARWGLGELSHRLGEYDEAVGWYEDARRDAMKVMQFPGSVDLEEARHLEAYCLFGLGRVVFERGEIKSSMLALGEALEKAQKLEDKVLEADILCALAEATWRAGDGDRAEIYRRRGLMLAEASEDRESFAEAQLMLAERLRDSGQPQDSLARLQAAQSLFEELGKRHHVAHCLLLRGDIARGRGDNKEAAQLYRKAHRFYEMFRDRKGLTACKRSLAVLALSIGRLPDTQSLLRDALEGYRAMGSKRGEAVCWIAVGQLEAALEKHEKAMKTLSDAARSLHELGDVRAELSAQALRLAAAEHSRMHEEVESLVPKLISRIDSYSITSDAVAGALEALTTSVGTRRPDLAIDLDVCAEQVWARLGRPVRVEA